MNPSWKRISGVHVQDDGAIGVVWMAHEKEADAIHIYDCCNFRLEVFTVIAEGINARGRWIPVAWEKGHKDICDNLLDRGCNMLPEPFEDTEKMAEVVSRDIWERMRTGRLKVDKRLAEWLDEYESFHREDSKIPQGAFPLMAATRYAVGCIKYAKRQSSGLRQRNYPSLATI